MNRYWIKEYRRRFVGGRPNIRLLAFNCLILRRRDYRLVRSTAPYAGDCGIRDAVVAVRTNYQRHVYLLVTVSQTSSRYLLPEALRCRQSAVGMLICRGVFEEEARRPPFKIRMHASAEESRR